MKFQVQQQVFVWRGKYGEHLMRSVGEPHDTIDQALAALLEAQARTEVIVPDNYVPIVGNDNRSYHGFLIEPLWEDGKKRKYHKA
ncbi:MAG: hypothetical protein WC050_00665 [Candidatus Paceibacterota bacterium]